MQTFSTPPAIRQLNWIFWSTSKITDYQQVRLHLHSFDEDVVPRQLLIRQDQWITPSITRVSNHVTSLTIWCDEQAEWQVGITLVRYFVACRCGINRRSRAVGC